MRNIARTAQILVGFVLVVSAFAKAWGGNEFANLVIQYGADWFTVFVPILIAIETALAVMLLFNIYARNVALFSGIFIAGISLIFLYGVLALRITECGCFGVLHSLNLSPTWTFIRNIILIGLCVTGYSLDDKQGTCKWWKMVVLTAMVASSVFICGLDMSKAFQLPTIQSMHRRTNANSEQLGLNDLLPLSIDSCYAVYLFSYTCAYCQNSFANVEQYQRLNVVDQVYGLAIEDQEGEKRFRRIYQPSIPIKNIPLSTMNELVAELPVLLIIQHGEIVETEVGSVLSPGLKMQ